MNNTTQKKIQIIIEEIIKGKGRTMEMAKNYQVLGGQFANVSDSMMEKATQLANKQEFYKKQMNSLGITGRQVDNILSNYGFTFDRNGILIDKAGRSIKNINQVMKEGKIQTKRFNMNLLSTMFFGMSIQRVFNGLIKTSLEWVGIQELMNTTLGIVFLPIAEDLLDILLPIMMWFIDLPDPIKEVIGAITLLGATIGATMFTLSTLGLGLQGLGTILGIDFSAGIISGLKSKLGSFDISKYLRYGGAIIAITWAIKDLTEGEVVAAIGMGLIGAGFILGGPYGIALGIVGVALKLFGDEDFTIGVIKVMYRIGDFISDILKEAVMSGLTFRYFDPTKIEGLTNLKRAFNIAAEQISMEDAMKGIGDSVMYPTEQIKKLKDEQIKLQEQVDEGINVDQYTSQINNIETEIDNLIKKYELAMQKAQEFSNSSNNVTKTISPKKTLSNLLLPDLGSLGKVLGIGDGIVQNGNVITTNPNDYLIATKNPSGLGGGSNISVTYNISGVSSPEDIRRMLAENNRKLSDEIRRSVKT
ncbi:MAG: hypothetical protein ACFFG0_03160 [Candidatus Thorarchaeota archaeon]